jgi:hypothetical protein
MGPETGLETTVGSFCFAAEKPRKTADLIVQVG